MVALLATAMACLSAAVRANGIVAYDAIGDSVAAPLAGAVGDATRGRGVVLDRQIGNCLICHSVPGEPQEAFQGNIGPPLAGVGQRFNVGQLRFRLIDQSRNNPNTVMPPYYRVGGLVRVPARFAGQPVLDAQRIEDVVAYLATLKE